jgi:hypothetical protein
VEWVIQFHYDDLDHGQLRELAEQGRFAQVMLDQCRECKEDS